jgi:hypothetical protein
MHRPINTAKMRFIIALVLAWLPFAVLGKLSGPCTGDQATGLWGSHGICITTGTCKKRGGVYKKGACPDDKEDVKCCLLGLEESSGANPCEGASYCTWKSNSCPKQITGECPGGEDYVCCKLF